MSYYFLVASLPSITLETEPPLKLAAFRSLCADHLSADDAGALNQILDFEAVQAVTHPFAKQWIASETQLRNAAARQRGIKRQEDAADFIRDHTGFDAGLEESVEAAFALSNPLSRERALDQIRWQVLDTLTGTDPFSANVVLAYGIKLRMAERWAAMNQEQGKANIDVALAPSEAPKDTETIKT